MRQVLQDDRTAARVERVGMCLLSDGSDIRTRIGRGGQGRVENEMRGHGAGDEDGGGGREQVESTLIFR